MSLMIQALAKAEKDKQAELSKKYATSRTAGIAPSLELAPIEDNRPESAQAAAAVSVPAPADAGTQKIAANLFAANQPVNAASSKSALLLLGVAGALMVWLGIEGSRYISELAAPDAIAVKATAPAAKVADALTIAQTAAQSSGLEAIGPDSMAHQAAAANQNGAVMVPATPSTHADAAESAGPANGAAETASVVKAAGSAPLARPKPVKNMPHKQRQNSASAVTPGNDAQLQAPPPQQGSLSVSSRTPLAGVDPTLLSAYQAFGRGEDASAQQLYRQVLQRDVRNVDALLGMAAIAQRQGRGADAIGWYHKVLEIEPRNIIAQSAVAVLHANADMAGAESRIKNLLVQQPEAANLHAALGNLYAEQNQWTLAQDAYFNASRFAPDNADYAFNLAISLDQLGKSSLALAQYQRALEMVNNSGAPGPDRAQLEARIQTLQGLN